MSTYSFSFEDAVAKAVIDKFDALPQKSKPSAQHDGIRRWIPLSGIVLSNGTGNELRCVALGTGMKCLSAVKVAGTHGNVLHDWHAEVLAIRAFNHFLLQECLSLLQDRDFPSVVVEYNEEKTGSEPYQPFKICDDIKIHMYSSEAPCGDASMELVMDAQDDASPWPISPSNQAKPPDSELQGRGYFSELGIVRRKPARGDSLPSLSKSCSDKLALKQCTSLLNSNTIDLISPNNAHLQTLVLPHAQYTESGSDRAFGARGRMKTLIDKTWPGGFSYCPFSIRTTSMEFKFSRRRLSHPGEKLKGASVSAVWTPHLNETLINGVLQGRKQCDVKGASSVSRRRMNQLSSSVTSHLDVNNHSGHESVAFFQRRLVKEDVIKLALRGWIANCTDGCEKSR